MTSPPVRFRIPEDFEGGSIAVSVLSSYAGGWIVIHPPVEDGWAEAIQLPAATEDP